MNKKIILLAIFCMVSYQNIFKEQFFRNLQAGAPPPPPPPPPPDGSCTSNCSPPPPPPDNGDGSSPPPDNGDGGSGGGPQEQLPPAPPDFDGQVNDVQSDIDSLDAEIQQQQVLADSDDIDASINGANKIVELNFQREKLKRQIFNINQQRQQFFQKQEIERAMKEIRAQETKFNYLLGQNYQNIQQGLQKQLFVTQGSEQIAAIIAAAQVNIDDLIQKALALNDSNFALFSKFQNNRTENLNKNIEFLNKDNQSNTIISPTGKQDIVNAINGMKSEIEAIKKEVAAMTLQKGVRAKQIADIKINFANFVKQVQENRGNQEQTNNAYGDLQKCLNDQSLKEQLAGFQQLMNEKHQQRENPDNSQEQNDALDDEIDDLDFQIKANNVQQIKQALRCNELNFSFNVKQESNIKASQLSMEKNKSVAILQEEKDFISNQQEKARQALLNVQQQLKQIAEEKISLNKRLTESLNTSFVQDQNVRQIRDDIHNQMQKFQEVQMQIQNHQKNIQDQLNNPDLDCRKKLDIAQGALRNIKQLQDNANLAKQLNDKLNAVHKTFVDNSNLQANQGILALNKEFAAATTPEQKEILSGKIQDFNEQLANAKQAQAKQLEQYQMQDKMILGIVAGFQNQLNNLINENQFKCNQEQIPQLAQQLVELDAQIAQSKDQLASATIPEAEKVNLRAAFGQLLAQRNNIVSSQNRINLYQLSQQLAQNAANIKNLTAQIAQCNLIPVDKRDAETTEKCAQAQQQLDIENAFAKQSAAQKASLDAFAAANSAANSQQQKIDEQSQQIGDLEAKIQGGWQQIQAIQQNNQNQIDSAVKVEEKISLLQQQQKSLKDIENIIIGLKDLHVKLAAAQKLVFDNQAAKIALQIADVNKALLAATLPEKKAGLQIQLDGLNALAAQNKNFFAQQSAEIAAQNAKLGSFAQNNANQINNEILSNQSEAFNAQVNGFQQQIQELDNQINQLNGQLAQSATLSDQERQMLNDKLAALQKQRTALQLNRDQIAIQNASAVNTLSTNELKDLTIQLAECKKQLAANPANQQQAEQCNNLQIKFDQLNAQIKQSADQKAQLTATITVQSGIVSQQQKIDESNRQLGDLMKQISDIFNQVQQNRIANEQQANSEVNCQARINILKQQLSKQQNFQGWQASLKALLAKLPAAQKSVQDNSNAQLVIIIADLTKRIAASTNAEEKARLQQQLNDINAMQAKNLAQSAKMAAENLNHNAFVAGLIDNFVNGINNRIAESQSECFNNQLKDQEAQMQQLQDQIAQFKGQSTLDTLTQAQRDQINASIEQASAKQNIIKLDHEKIAVQNSGLVNQIITFQLKNLAVQQAECNKALSSAASAEQIEKCKQIQGQIDAQNLSIKSQAAQKAQAEQQVAFLAGDVGLQSKCDQSKKLLDDQNRLIQEQQARINAFRQQNYAQLEKETDLKAKVAVLNDQLARAKELDALIAQLKALLDKLPALQKAHADNWNALVAARLANVTKRIADAILAKADTAELLKQQAEITAVQNNVKAFIASNSAQVAEITAQVATSSAQYQNNIKQQVAQNLKANSDNAQQAQQQQAAQLQAQIAELDNQINAEQDPKQKVVLFNQRQDLLLQRLQGDNNQCKAFFESVDARKQLLQAQIAQQQADVTACNAALLANKDATQTSALTQKCAGLKTLIEKSNLDLKGVDEQKKKCDDLVASNGNNINAAQNQQKIQVAQQQIQDLQNNISNGVNVQESQKQIYQIQEQAKLLEISQKQIQVKNLPAEIAQCAAQIALEKDAVKLADLNKQLAQKKADLAAFTLEINNYSALMKKKLDEQLALAQKQINEAEAANKAKILAQSLADAENNKKQVAEQNEIVKQKLAKINDRIAAETKILDQMKYECDLKDKQARQALLDLQNKQVKAVKDADAKQQAILLKQKQEQERKAAEQLKQNTANKDQQLNQAKVDNSIDGQRKIALDQIKIS